MMRLSRADVGVPSSIGHGIGGGSFVDRSKYSATSSAPRSGVAHSGSNSSTAGLMPLDWMLESPSSPRTSASYSLSSWRQKRTSDRPSQNVCGHDRSSSPPGSSETSSWARIGGSPATPICALSSSLKPLTQCSGPCRWLTVNGGGDTESSRTRNGRSAPYRPRGRGPGAGVGDRPSAGTLAPSAPGPPARRTRSARTRCDELAVFSIRYTRYSEAPRSLTRWFGTYVSAA